MDYKVILNYIKKQEEKSNGKADISKLIAFQIVKNNNMLLNKSKIQIQT